MKRSWSTVRSGPDEASQEVALAIAQIADSETLRSFLDTLTALDRFGGELYIGAYRKKFDAQGNIVEPDEVGEYETVGYAWHYEHVAKRTAQMTGAEEEPSVSLASPVALGDESQNGHEETPVPEPVEAA